MEESTVDNNETNMDVETNSEMKSNEQMKENIMILEHDKNAMPIIIEELDENAIDSMDMDMTEFKEAKALKVHDVSETIISSYMCSQEGSSVNDILMEIDDQNMILIEEERLTKQFVNGEVTFSEYSSKIIETPDPEISDIDINERDSEKEQEVSHQVVNKKERQKTTMLQSSGPRKRRRMFPPILQGLMGEANIRFARGEIDIAEKLCMEIIRQAPSAPEPFQTLAMIYENDQPERSLQYALIAAHLSPKDADQWTRLANLSLESGNINQAIMCYSKAIQANPKDVHLYESLIELEEQNGDKKAHIKAYTRLLHHLDSDQGQDILKYAKILAKRHMQENNNEQAFQAIECIFVKCPELITLEEVNIMTELLISLKHFNRCLDTLIKYTNIWVRFKETSDKNDSESPNVRVIETCDMPDDVVVDLKAKFLITLIELNEIVMADKLLPKLLTEDPEVSGDLFLDVAESFMGKNEFQRALILLDPLVKSTHFSLAAVWLRHAECWVGCKDLKKAIKSYEVVKELSPKHLGARLALAKLYKFKGQYSKAAEVLKQDPETDTLDPNVIYMRTLLLYKTQKYDEYFESGMLLLSRHCMNIRSKAELGALTRATGVRQRLESLQLHRLSCGEKLIEEDQPTFINSEELSEKNEFLLLIQMCKLAYTSKRFGLLQRICFTALTSKRFEKRNSHIVFLCLISCIHNNDSFYGYNIVREIVKVCRRSNSINLLNIVIQGAEDSRHNRFIMRLLGREDAFSHLHIMHANNCLVSGTYTYALNDYISLFRVMPNPLLALLTSVTLLQMACQKNCMKKNQLIIQAIAFIKKYAQLRGEDGRHETYYNTARVFHQIGLFPSAIHYYKLVLHTDPGELVKQNEELLDLKKEAAFNLHLIYLQSENFQLARMYLEDYITI
ncbi:general transcription factor 3C polypeptide 3-like isoform X1 [Polistes fuscatus]|uniref:general transcription factor 3C polypeptide 3-like isoform X1 n=1 Tax=Polistes fuscatus TaxID=30207 RepID=UPI001CA9AAD3|nr:general transcription factor 3C polypeptide 3-like isoform X1 [Polistes fuscatus]XP_043485980.1 general transcription factor 3C polypeptide 3-like isoform X1 [Polistes fuscatus]